MGKKILHLNFEKILCNSNTLKENQFIGHITISGSGMVNLYCVQFLCSQQTHEFHFLLKIKHNYCICKKVQLALLQ
jgi:hypothetical protein